MPDGCQKRSASEGILNGEKNLTGGLPKAARSVRECSRCQIGQKGSHEGTLTTGSDHIHGPHSHDFCRVGKNDITGWQLQHGHLARWTDAVLLFLFNDPPLNVLPGTIWSCHIRADRMLMLDKRQSCAICSKIRVQLAAANCTRISCETAGPRMDRLRLSSSGGA